MSAHVKGPLAPRALPARPTALPFGHRAGSGALHQEVPIRTLGARAIHYPGGEVLKGEQFEEESTTMLLFPQGAVIRLEAPVVCGQDLMLVNKRTNKYAHCRVKNLRTSPDVKSYVEVEFTHSNADFWGITFPKGMTRAAAATAPLSAIPAPSPFVEADGVEDGEDEISRNLPSKAMAAAIGVAPAPSVAASFAVPTAEPLSAPASAPAPVAFAAAAAPTAEKPAAIPWRIPAPPQQPAEERSGSDNAFDPSFFATRPTEAVPVCEPVVSSTKTVAAVDATETAPEPPPMANWEALSVAEPRKSRWRLVALGAALLLAVNVAYRFYLPMAPLPTAQQIVVPPQPAEGTQTMSPANSTAATPTPAPPSVVTARVPEMIPENVPQHQRVVLVSKMAAPAHATTADARAPELNVGSASAPSVSGNNAGLLATNAAPPPPAEPEPVKAADTLVPARLVHSAQPVYPPVARTAQIQGSVVVEAQLDATGNVTSTRVISGPAALRAAAQSAVMQWKFEPARLHDQPTSSTTTVTLHFSLR